MGSFHLADIKMGDAGRPVLSKKELGFKRLTWQYKKSLQLKITGKGKSLKLLL